MSRSCSSCPTYVFESRIIQEIQKWVQTINYRRSPEMLFSKELDVLLIFEFFCQYKCISKTNSEKFKCRTFKGQIISKRLLVSSDSSKKRLTVLKTNLFVRFLEESEDTKKSFRNYLTFRIS
jgi:hypothetical protein